VGYVPLNNYNHDGGYKRIQSGPNHQGFIVLTSGSTAYGADEGIIVPGSPLSGNLTQGVWGYDANWRYVPSTLPSQSGALDPTPYNVSGALDTYDATRIYTRDNVGGAQAASAIGPETGKVNPRGGALQPRADVTRPETYMYFGGAAPDNQDYSPYNTPDANSAAEGKTGGGVTHRSFESSLLTNVLGSQGTSDRSQWRYHQPVYCKTYTETRRSESPGLMSTPLRYVYRGSASSYNYNYAGELLANKGGFEPLNYDDFGGGCDIPVACPTTTGDPTNLQPGDILRGTSACTYKQITWYNTSSSIPVASGETYTVQESDYFYKLYYKVEYPNGTTDQSSIDCFGTVRPPGYGTFWINRVGDAWRSAGFLGLNPCTVIDKYGNSYTAWQRATNPGSNNPNETFLYVQKRNNIGEEVWTFQYASVPQFNSLQRVIPILDPTNEYLYVGWGAAFRRPDAPTSQNIEPSLELFKISPSTGSLIWRHYYIFTPSSATYWDYSFTRIQYDEYLNKIYVFYRNFFLAQGFLIDPDSPGTITTGTAFWEGNTLESLRTIEDAMVIRPKEDPTNTFVVTIDNGNRYIWWETDEYFRSTTGASGLRYGSTTTFTYNNPVRMEPASVTFSGQEHFVSANHELSIGTLVVWNKQRRPVLNTNTPLGFPFAVAKNPNDPTSVYVAFCNPDPIRVSGVNYRPTAATLGVAEYTPETNRIKNYSYLTVVSGIGVSINSDQSRAALFGGPGAINTNIENVNRVVFTYYNQDTNVTSTAAIASGINSLFIIGASVVASGLYKNLNWNNTAGFSGGAGAVNNVNQPLGGSTLPTLSAPFPNFSAAVTSPYKNGPDIISGGPVDLTGTITNVYGYIDLD
jgi:hypothetical protein